MSKWEYAGTLHTSGRLRVLDPKHPECAFEFASPPYDPSGGDYSVSIRKIGDKVVDLHVQLNGHDPAPLDSEKLDLAEHVAACLGYGGAWGFDQLPLRTLLALSQTLSEHGFAGELVKKVKEKLDEKT